MIKGNKDLALHAVEALNVGYLAFNTEKKPFDNVLVRQALNYATDKQAIVKAVFLDSGSVAKSPIPSTMLGYKKDLPDYDYDPQKAKALLKQAGLEQGAEVTCGQCRSSALQPKLKTHCRNDPKRLGESGGESQNCQL